MTDWQPIETAPKDKADIILAFDGISAPGHWIGDEWWWFSSGEEGPCDPTHWMPLPEPPTLLLTEKDEHTHSSRQHWCPECGPL